MAAFDLRPLSLGEVLDRTFTLYRRNFLLFIGISLLPQILVLAINLANVLFASRAIPLGSVAALGGAAFSILLGLLIAILSVLAYLFSQGGTIFAITDIYLGRTTSIMLSLRRVWGELLSLFGVIMLNGLAIAGATVFFILPGIYVLCRLLVCVPAALVENRGPRDSLSRSWALTKGDAGRSFIIIVLYFILVIALSVAFVSPFSWLSTQAGPRNPQMSLFWLIMANVGSTVASALVSPIFLIATSVFYFDLRVRKEAFDIQFMMDPTSERVTGPGSGSSVPSILS